MRISVTSPNSEIIDKNDNSKYLTLDDDIGVKRSGLKKDSNRLLERLKRLTKALGIDQSFGKNELSPTQLI